MSTDVTAFSEQLAYLAKGSLNDECTEELAELIKAVRLTGKKGTLTLTIEVGMLDKSSEDAMRITGDVKTKPPRLDKPTTIMFSTYDGDLLRDDPEQLKMELRQVGVSQPEQARRVDAAQKPNKQVTTSGA